MSLAVPGAGQLAAAHLSFVAWFASAGFLAALPAMLGPSHLLGTPWCTVPIWLLLAGASAEHAKRCLETQRNPTRHSEIRARRSFCLLRGDRVSMRQVLLIARPAAELWRDLADFSRFVCIDPFHSRVTVLASSLCPGVDLAIEHRAFGFTVMRFGRLLRWREGCGYAFSDLSAHGPRHGFPHVFFVDLRPSPSDPERSSILTIDVRGKWTATWVPRAVRRCWLRYVQSEHARLLRAAL